jgi:hypothetical protein
MSMVVSANPMSDTNRNVSLDPRLTATPISTVIRSESTPIRGTVAADRAQDWSPASSREVASAADRADDGDGGREDLFWCSRCRCFYTLDPADPRCPCGARPGE